MAECRQRCAIPTALWNLDVISEKQKREMPVTVLR